MPASPNRIQSVLLDPLGFVGSILSGFRANQGFLLAGAVAYYTLLSIVPMFALILVVLSQVIEPQRLLDITQGYLSLVAPGKAPALVAQIEVFINNWKRISIIKIFHCTNPPMRNTIYHNIFITKRFETMISNTINRNPR